MARPTRTNAEYFYHPASFRNDRRVKAIRARFGACGYGLLMMLIEALTDADNIELSMEEIEIELLAGDLSSTVEDITALIQSAEKVGLFTRSDAGFLKCPQLDEWLAPVFEKRNRSRNTPTAPKLSQPVTETAIPVTVIPPVQNSTEQYRTEQYKKEKPITSLRSVNVRKESELFTSFWQAYPRKESRMDALRAFNKLNADEQTTATQSVIEWFARKTDWIRPDGSDYRPHASSWLNQKRWQDLTEITITQPPIPHGQASSTTHQPGNYQQTRTAPSKFEYTDTDSLRASILLLKSVGL